MSSPLRQRETVFVVIGTRRCVRTTAVLHASSREYGPPRVVSQRSEEYELSMNPTVSYPIVFFLIQQAFSNTNAYAFHRLNFAAYTGHFLQRCTSVLDQVPSRF